MLVNVQLLMVDHSGVVLATTVAGPDTNAAKVIGRRAGLRRRRPPNLAFALYAEQAETCFSESFLFHF
jgi:hypothetical protein